MVTVSTPRNRGDSFDPQFIKKRETMLAKRMAEKIISMYALEWMEENLGSRASPETISLIMDVDCSSDTQFLEVYRQ